ncbi:hypothetical protein SAMN05880593_110143 [Rhizobium sp. RU36D]|nr:hypothetical protein SAMN05880593_110143 [Rhizobium sp. RU36D]
MMECRDHEAELAHTLSFLVAGAVEGLVGDVVVLDHGSSDGTSSVADAAGCRYYGKWDIKDILRGARGEWLMLVEPGARLQQGWIEEVGEYITLGKQPARFTESRHHRRPLYQRMLRKVPPLEHGFLLPKREAVATVNSGMSLGDIARSHKPRRLTTEIIPSWVARRATA